MKKIVTLKEAAKLSEKLRGNEKKIVLAGGCFDILHIGHIEFLEAAKKQGDALFVLLESDKTIRNIKGKNRPVYPQKIRAQVLSALENVDYVVLLPRHCTNNQYDAIIQHLRPAIIATTKGDMQRHHKQRQAKLTGAKVIDVISKISDESSTKLAHLLSNEDL